MFTFSILRQFFLSVFFRLLLRRRVDLFLHHHVTCRRHSFRDVYSDVVWGVFFFSSFLRHIIGVFFFFCLELIFSRMGRRIQDR